jgi:hypothetical protein
MVQKKKKTKKTVPYSEETAILLCDLLSQGNSLRSICREYPNIMPEKSSVFDWIIKYPEFKKRYDLAKEESARALAEDLLEIADMSSGEIVGGKDSGDNARVQARKLQVDTRKWIMSKLMPKKYGDKLDMTTNGKDLPVPILGGLSQTTNELPDNHSS